MRLSNRRRGLLTVALAGAMLFAGGACRGDGGEPGATASPAEEVHDMLDGTYEARLSPETFRGTSGLPPLPGRWTLTFDGPAFILETKDFRVGQTYDLRDGMFIARGVPAPEGAYNCFRDGRRLSLASEAEGTYSYESGEAWIRFSAADEPCPAREVFLARRWGRVEER